MKQQIYLNGEFVAKEDAKVSVYDHGFLYGDGVFEGIRIYNGNIFKYQEHIDRLYDSAKSIKLNVPLSYEEMEKAVVETVKRNQLKDGYIRLIVSRGVGDLGLNPDLCPKATVIIIVEQLAIYSEEDYQRGLKLVSVSTRRNIPDALNPKIKSLNYLNNILVKIQANLAGVGEALMLNREGFVSEGSGDNIFIIKNNKIITPPSYVGALEGITRAAIMEICDTLGYEVHEEPFALHDVYVADEVFLTGTAAEVIAVREVDGRVIGKGEAGPITLKLLDEFRHLVNIDGLKI
ncbi:branched-chain-amino-acid transaminase [Longirhabdus pacifica]|uniref:branched-chain-amino-acid transaminase n=1 Tax=Longirhabdus pacifica TaxID=2305227 RepID=UPI001008AE70|nr:branched-chain-amino-acid transaminase [Longirhabdus pacifica]